MRTFDPIGGMRRACWAWVHRRTATWRGHPDAWDPFGQLADSDELADVRRFVRAEDYWGAAGTLKRHVTANLPGRFFSGVCDGALPALLGESFPDDRDRTIADAEKLCRGRFDLLGHRDLAFGDPPDWHLDPLTRRRAPLVHGSLFTPDEGGIGDRALVFELNRHQWLIPLGQAYRLTGEPRFAERFERSVRDWIRMNPFGMGINWSDTFEVSLRLIAWCWALALFLPSPVFTPDFFTLLIDHLRLHAVFIDRYRSPRGAADRTAAAEALGLVYAGLLFSEFRRADSWRRRGIRMLEAQINRQITEDGAHCSQSTDEQRFTLEIALHLLLLAERQAVPTGPSLRGRIKRLFDGLLRLQRPDGAMQPMGERGPGWLIPLSGRDPDDWRGLYAAAAAFFREPHYAWAAGGRRSEVLWLMGPAGLAGFDGLVPAPPAGRASAVAEPSGYVQMRSGWDRRAHHLVFDVGPSHARMAGGSSLQRDQLGIQCSAFGEPVVLDPRPSRARDDQQWRTFLRGESHSTIVIDGVPHQALGRLFARRIKSRTSFRQWTANERFELAEADHDGYLGLLNPVLHRRRVLFVNRAYWLLIDDLEGRGRHRIELVFHLATDLVDLDEGLLARVWTREGPGLAIKPLSTVSLRAELKQDAPSEHDEEHRAAALRLTYSAEVTMPYRLVTHLFPLADKQATVPVPTPFFDERGTLSGSVIDRPPATIMFSDRSVTVEAA